MENHSKDVERLRRELRSYNMRTVLAVIGSGALMSAAFIYGVNENSLMTFLGAPLITWIAGAFGFILLWLAVSYIE